MLVDAHHVGWLFRTGRRAVTEAPASMMKGEEVVVVKRVRVNCCSGSEHSGVTRCIELARGTLVLHTATVPVCQGKDHPKGYLATRFLKYDVRLPVIMVKLFGLLRCQTLRSSPACSRTRRNLSIHVELQKIETSGTSSRGFSRICVMFLHCTVVLDVLY